MVWCGGDLSSACIIGWGGSSACGCDSVSVLCAYVSKGSHVFVLRVFFLFGQTRSLEPIWLVVICWWLSGSTCSTYWQKFVTAMTNEWPRQPPLAKQPSFVCKTKPVPPLLYLHVESISICIDIILSYKIRPVPSTSYMDWCCEKNMSHCCWRRHILCWGG